MKTKTRIRIGTTLLLLGLAACSRTPEPAEPATAGLASLQTRLTQLSSGLEHAQALRSIKRLQWAYGHYSELGLWYDFADLFADSGIGHYVQGDLNRDEIRTLFHEQVGQGRLGLANGRIYPHISFSPVVDLEDGSHGRGRFRILAMLGGYGGNATWFHGVYENAYVQEQGIWKLNEISNTAQISGSYTNGLSAQSKAPLDQATFPLHFDAELVGSMLPATASNAPDLAASENTMMLELASIQQGLQQLEDEAELVNLQHQYGYYLDRHEWNSAAALFAKEGTYEAGQQGVYRGRDSIRRGLALGRAEGLATGEVDEHILFQTYVTIAPDGQTARARVDELGMHGEPGGSAQWSQGIYENIFVREAGQWRIQSLHYYPRLITDYAKGWALDAQPAPAASTVFPPDAPARESYEIYPAFYIPPFHFVHPVTGRLPQYPGGDGVIGSTPDPTVRVQTAQSANVLFGSTSLQSVLPAAEVRLLQSEASDAAENLVNAYAYYLDECMTQAAASLFATEGRNEIPGIGYYQGAERISTSLRQAYCPEGRKEGELTLHHALQPLISVAADGNSVTISSRLWQIHVAGSLNDYYLMGQLDGQAIRENGQWKLAELSTRYHWVAPVSEGWARASENATLNYAAPEQMLMDFPPDLPAHNARLAAWP